MAKDVFTFIVGGKAGEGVKKAGNAAANLFASRGLNVFQYDDYQSLIKGGHNFAAVSASARELTSHYLSADLVVNLDARSQAIHAAKGGIVVNNSDAVKTEGEIGLPLTAEAKKFPDPALRIGLGAVVCLSAAIGESREATLDFVRKEYKRDLENNMAYAGVVHGLAVPALGGKFKLDKGGKARPMLYGNEAIALGAAAGGLDIYVAYPMTPASSILHYLAAHSEQLGIAVMHPENEIAVANMAIGAAAVGARAMVGSSGGGFALMEEAGSLAGMTETPLLMVLSSRPGPSTGVPTYTAQGDLNFALGQGHGDSPKIVASPSSASEAFRLTAELLDLAWEFQVPAILLSEKHLAESRMSVDVDIAEAAWAEGLAHGKGEYKRYLDASEGISPLLFPPSTELIKWNSYEHDENGITSDTPEAITRMHDKRARKASSLAARVRGLRTVNVFGSGRRAVFAYGSTAMSAAEAIRHGGLDARVVQPIYLDPLPSEELAKHAGVGAIVVEQSSTGQFARLLCERARIDVKHAIAKYDGRPFEPTELAAKLKEAL
ncbi:MAG: 2-oxoacid:acceptor oxidoreductase family protein [Methanobacteriota archaeon]